MSTQLPAVNGQGLTPALINSFSSLAKTFIDSGLFSDTKSQAQALTKIIAGHELGMGPFESMRDLSIIQGKIAMGGAQIGARIKKSGDYDYEILQFTAEACVIRFTKRGKALSPDITFTIEDARKLGLAGKDNYNKQARTMLYWRALTMGARLHCPHVFGGPIYTPDELRGEPPAEIVEVTPVDDNLEHGGIRPAVVEPEPYTLPENPWTHCIQGDSNYREQPLFLVPEDVFKKLALPRTLDRFAKNGKLSPVDVAAIMAANADWPGRYAAQEAYYGGDTETFGEEVSGDE